MIKSFKCKETSKIFHRLFSKKLPQSIQKLSIRKLWLLDAAIELNDLRIPAANRLETLKGNRKGKHSIRINDQCRICFKWHAGNAHNVEIIDYH